MQVILAIILLIGVFFLLSRKTKNSFNQMSQTARVGIFSFIIGLIFKFLSTIVAVNSSIMNSYDDSPGFFYQILSFVSGTAFMVAVACFILGLYRFFFHR